jgi:hypothetical protein
MSFLNFTLQRGAYQDATPVTNPQQKNFDFTLTKCGLTVNSPISHTKIVTAGQTLLLESTGRTMPSLNTTEFEFSRPIASSDLIRMRYTGTGTAPGFRTKRTIGSDATTTVDITSVSSTAKLITASAGTAFNFSSVLVGDVVYLQVSDDAFTTPFEGSSVGRHYPVVDVTSTALTVRDNGNLAEQSNVLLGADFDSAFRVFSNTGVYVGDKLKFNSAAAFKSDNKAYVVEILDVTDRDLYYVNPAALPETTVSNVAAPFLIYERLLNFVALEANGPLKVLINGSETIELAEYESGSAFFAGTLHATSVHAVNETGSSITVSLQACSF